MSLTVKAYLTRAGQHEPEIRRFGIDADVSSNYNYFVSKLNSIFPGLSGKTYTLGWKDSEGDLILFSSDEELTEALGYVNDGVFKVYIAEKSEASNKGAEKPCEWKRGPKIHWGVVCDGCQGPVAGLRYKCEVCPDFDLCETCKGKNLHSEHPMKTIEKNRRCHFAFGGEGPAGREQCGPFPCPPEFGPEHAFSGAATFSAAGPGFGAAAGMGPGFIPPFLRGCNIEFDAMPPHMARRIQRKLMRKYLCEKYSKCCKKARKCEKRKEEKKLKKKEKKEKKQKEKEAKAAEEKDVEGEKKERQRKVSTSSGSSSSSSSSDEAEEQSPSEGYLKNVGESVAAMLDPLGIDVEVDIEHNGMRRRCHRGWGGFGGRGGMGFGGGRGGWGWGGHWDGHWGRGMRGGPCGGRGGRAGWFCPRGFEPTAPGATSMDTGEAAKNGAGANVSPPRDPDWTFIPPPGSDVEGAARMVENMHVTPESGAIPSTSAASAASVTVGANVAESLAKMQSMGYSDDGGWLTALLTAHNGDVNLALDALQAKK